MKIVNLQTFRSLPANTVFAKYAPCAFDDLCIKGETWENDFLVQQITDSIECSGSDEFVDKLYHAAETGESVSFDFDCEGRDGLYETEQLFAAWEPDDVRALIARLSQCLPNVIGMARRGQAQIQSESFLGVAISALFARFWF